MTGDPSLLIILLTGRDGELNDNVFIRVSSALLGSTVHPLIFWIHSDISLADFAWIKYSEPEDSASRITFFFLW